MKKIIFSLFILIDMVAFGQYSFNVTKYNYLDLTNPISINNGSSWNCNSSFPIYFNFNFSILDQTYTALNVMTGGGLSFPGLGTKELRVYNDLDNGYLLEDRNQTNSVSPINYEIVGDQGQRILKIEWKNAGFKYICTTSDKNDYANFQIWLYESTNRIEVHFGDYMADAGTYGNPDCNTGKDGLQFVFIFDICNNALSLTGPCDLPSYDFRDHCSWQPIHISGTPTSGIVYNLSPVVNVLKEEFPSSVKVFYSPINKEITISEIPNDLLIQEVLITDICGKIVIIDSKVEKQNNSVHILVDNIGSGIYFYKIIFLDNKTITGKLIKNCH